jgi:hypothetical protein
MKSRRNTPREAILVLTGITTVLLALFGMIYLEIK